MYIDLLTRIKNTQAAGKKTLKVPYTKADHTILTILKRAGYLKEIEIKGRAFKKVIEIHLNPERPIQGIRFLSRPSLRRYAGYRDIRSVKGGYGLLVVSTPKGILAGAEARKLRVGGELLFEIW